jgi:hypothetical protein
MDALASVLMVVWILGMVGGTFFIAVYGAAR